MALPLDGSAHGNATSGTSIAVSLTTTKANDVIVALITTNFTNTFNTASVTSISSTNTTGWVQRGDVNRASARNQHFAEWWGTAAAALSSESITVNLNTTDGGTLTFVTVDLFGIAGANIGPTGDSNVSVPTITDTEGTTVSITTTNDLDFVIGGVRTGTASLTQGSGWTLISGANFQLAEYQFVTAAGSFTVHTSSDSSNVCSVGDAVVMSLSDMSARSVCIGA